MANGYAELDGTGKVPLDQIPEKFASIEGNWDASTNTPTLVDGTGDVGEIYVVNVAGTQDLGSGSQTFEVGDWVIYNTAGVWTKTINSTAVTSVNGQTGAVVLDLNDINDVNVGTPGPADDGKVVSWVDASSEFQLVTPAAGSSTLTVSSISSTTTASLSVDVYLCDTSGGAFTVDLPTAVGNSGKVFKFKYTDSGFANALTIDPNGAETVDGQSTTTINTQGETVEIVSDGSNWVIIDRQIPSEWITFTPTGNWTTNTTFNGRWKRVGDSIEMHIHVALSGAPNNANFTVNMPGSLLVDTSKLPSGTLANADNNVGHVFLNDTSTASNRSYAHVYPFSTSGFAVIASGVGSGIVDEVTPFTWASGDDLRIRMQNVPVSGWNA